MNPTPEISFDLKSAKKPFSRIGFALILFFLSTYAAQILFSAVTELLKPGLIEKGLPYSVLMLISSVTMYLVGFPIFFLTIRKLDTSAPEKIPCSGKTVATAFLISIALMYLGQIVGDIVYTTLYDTLGLKFSSMTIEIVSNIKWYEALIYASVIGPLVEELMFRKLIIDRTRMYGEKLSMIFSALMFAFFHMSLQQFFYAFLIGLLYAYLYLRRGSILNCWLLHALFNFFGSVLPLIIYEFVDMEAFLSATDMEQMYKFIEENMLGYSIVAAYSIVTIALAIIGFNIFLKKQKQARFKTTAMQLPKDSEATVAFTNIGVILFILFTIAYPFINYYMQV